MNTAYIPFLPAAATILVGLVASIIALCAIQSNRQIARKKNSLDTILMIKGDDSLTQGIKHIHRIHKDPVLSTTKYAYPEFDATDEAIGIRYTLNFYEYLAIGIHEKVYDEVLLKESMYTTVVNVAERCDEFIAVIRKNGQKTAFCHFDKLVNRWKNSPLKVKS